MSLKEKFISPDKEYTPIPFWFWNDTLSVKELKRQIHDFNEKGVNGFIIHPRIGLPKEIEYLSDTYMNYVNVIVQEANLLKMKVILYDEAMYPSGSAHGLVVKDNPEYATKGLRMKEIPLQKGINQIDPNLESHEELISIQLVKKKSQSEVEYESIEIIEKNKREIFLNRNGKWSLIIFVKTFTNGTIRGIHIGEDDREENAPKSSDLLNPEAIKKFIHITYDRYYKVLEKYFGNTIIGMFTDEPDIMGRCSNRELKPWTDDFMQYYIKNGNTEKDLISLWFEVGDNTKKIRDKFRKTINKRLGESYYSQISKWCEDHNISLTGHPQKSDDINLLKYFHIPGQDIVWRWIAPEDDKGVKGSHSTLGKCTSDAARHRGKRRNGNECFGCCGFKGNHWSFSVDEMKWYLDWLFIRGVNLIYPHAFYYSIKGLIRINERPPDVGPNNIWWPHYKIISSYIKRMSYIMTDSYNTTDIAILCSGDSLPFRIAEHLFKNQIEFNYLEEEIFLNECKVDEGKVYIFNQVYTTLIIENAEIINENIIDKLKLFLEFGGQVVIYNYSKLNICGANSIENYGDIISIVENKNIKIFPKHKEIRVSEIIKEDKKLYVISNEGEENIDINVAIKEKGIIEKWDPWNGTFEIIKESKELKEDPWKMIIPLEVNRRELFILTADNTKSINNYQDKIEHEKVNSYDITDKWSIELQENKKIEIDSFRDWSTWQCLKGYSGTISYYNNIKIINSQKLSKIILDLGEVYYIAKVYINNKEVGIKFWRPYIFDITNAVKEDEIELKIEIANNVASSILNLIKGYKNSSDKKSEDEEGDLKSGLMGPVKIKTYKSNKSREFKNN